MTSKECYELVAKTLAQARLDIQPEPNGDIEFGFSVLQERVDCAFQVNNARFNRALFDAACKP